MSTALENRFTWPVIEADDRDPNVSWANHLARGSAGGVDLAYPYATPVLSPANGSLVVDADPGGSGGRMSILYVDHPELARIEFLHMSVTAPPGPKSIGQSLGLSGASGFGSDWYYARHLHVHAYHRNGARVNLWNYLPRLAPSGVDGTPITNSEDDMTITFIPDAQSATIRALNTDTGLSVPLGSPYHMQLMQRAITNKGGDKMLLAELHIVENYLRTISEPDVDVQSILAAVRAVTVTPEQIADAIKGANLAIDATLDSADIEAVAAQIAATLPPAITSEAVSAAVRGAIAEGIEVDATVPDETLDAWSHRLAKLIGIRLAGGDIAGS